MPGYSKQKNPRGIEITFEEENHRYSSIINNQELLYISGTTFIHKFFPKFDPTGAITKRCALKEGVTEDIIRQRWKEKANKSASFGTKIHETMEDVLQNRPLRNTPENEKEHKTMKNAEKLAKMILEKMEIIGIEKIVFDSDIAIAGTIDLLARSKKDGRIWILDHKTNERIEVYNRWNEFALKPIEHVANTNYCQYSLQLNLYENILKRVGYIDKDEKVEKALFHITEDGNQTYPIGNMQNEIELMIQSHLMETI